MRQRARFWTSRTGLWRSLCSFGRMFQLGAMAFVVFIFVLACAEAVHKPIVADHVQRQHIMPAAHTK